MFHIVFLYTLQSRQSIDPVRIYSVYLVSTHVYLVKGAGGQKLVFIVYIFPSFFFHEIAEDPLFSGKWIHHNSSKLYQNSTSHRWYLRRFWEIKTPKTPPNLKLMVVFSGISVGSQKMHGVLPESRGGRSDFHIPWVKDPKVRRAAIDTMASRAKSVTGTEEFFESFWKFPSFPNRCFSSAIRWCPSVWAQSCLSFPSAYMI